MSVELKTTNPPAEDIDLLLLIERAVLFFKKFRWVFIIAIIAGLAAGFAKYLSLQKTYKSQLILNSNILTNPEEIAIADTWNELLKKKEAAALVNLFQCKQETIQQLVNIDASEIQKVFTPTNPNGISIEVTVKDNRVLDDLQKGIIRGFENIDYVKQRIETKRASLQEMINKATEEIKKLESNSEAVHNIIAGNSKGSAAMIVDGSNINSQLIEMNQKLQSFKEELNFTSGIQLVQGFNKFSQPAGPRLFVWLALGLLVALSLAYIYAVFRSITEKIRARNRKV